MKIAFEEAKQAFIEDEVPIGCVIVKNDVILAKAHNRKEQFKLSLAHAEILAIKQACEQVAEKYLNDCDLYVTLEPCMMCMGAIIQARIKNVYFATTDPKSGAAISSIRITDIPKLNHYPLVYEGMMKEESSMLLKQFFKAKRNKNS
ncbi:MAG: nucleoside deaminase [Erysipelotrichaceae bacterium]|nr:nucleoside deaminase [Erysipelotrichaceae bacterium]